MSTGEPPPDATVWLVRLPLDHRALDGALRRHAPLLDDDERNRATRLAHPEARARFQASHTALRLVLGAAVGAPPGDLRFGRRACPLCGEAHGRPYLRDHPGTEFSLSSTPGLAAVAIGPMVVGVDVESELRPVTLDDLHVALHPRERAALDRLPAPAQRPAALQVWVRKEAYLKGLGVGLGVDPAGVDVGLGSPPTTGPPTPRAGPDAWALVDLCAGRGLHGALAHRGPIDTVVHLHDRVLSDLPTPTRT